MTSLLGSSVTTIALPLPVLFAALAHRIPPRVWFSGIAIPAGELVDV